VDHLTQDKNVLVYEKKPGRKSKISEMIVMTGKMISKIFNSKSIKKFK